MADAKEAARERVEQARDELVDLSHRIHANPELGFEEEQASAWVAERAGRGRLRRSSSGVGDLPTAFAAGRERARCTSRSAPSTTPCPASATPAGTT